MKLGGSYITKRIYISWRGLLFGDWFLVFRKLCHSFHHFPWPWACQDEKWLYHRTDIMAMARVRVLTPPTRGGLHRFSIGKTPCSEDWQKKTSQEDTTPSFFPHVYNLRVLQMMPRPTQTEWTPRSSLQNNFGVCMTHVETISKRVLGATITLAYHQILGWRHKAESVSLQTGNSLVVLKSGKVW